ncbi:hypothetical protein [Massilia horti]|uniref:Uncharacterized protein n=1 Tax=Massilia horti TaxID=2562153 RepID=A0A4Y9SVJ4_9BURK|nr:hypothetical protein [Massilia horti]TFW29234.1 hypothetical protein E4O92_19330 [Massilia horti]
MFHPSIVNRDIEHQYTPVRSPEFCTFVGLCIQVLVPEQAFDIFDAMHRVAGLRILHGKKNLQANKTIILRYMLFFCSVVFQCFLLLMAHSHTTIN